jgi:hypothetical protein
MARSGHAALAWNGRRLANNPASSARLLNIDHPQEMHQGGQRNTHAALQHNIPR